MTREQWKIIKRILFHFKVQNGCCDCNCKDGKFDFDHVRGEKLFDLGLGRYHSPEEIWLEMDKCEIRCHSCHTTRHKLGNKYNFGHVDSLELRARKSAIATERFKDPAERAKMSESLRGNQNNLGRVFSTKTRAKISASLKGVLKSPTARANNSTAAKKLWGDPTYRAKQSTTRTGVPWSPAQRAAYERRKLT